MSKRLKYAKLRLTKPTNADDPPPIVAPIQSSVGTVSTVLNKTSKYFDSGPCSNEETFILIHSEDSSEDNDKDKGQSLRRRTQKPANVCSDDGPKFPKLRKKTSDGNRLISTFMSSQTNQIVTEDDDFEECKTGTGSQSKLTKLQRVTKKTTKASKRIKNQSDIRKAFKKYKSDHEVLNELLKEHSTSDQIDPEQLQIALAMSRSLADQECDHKPTTSRGSLREDCSEESCSGASEERRIVSIRTTLEQFGFRCKNSYTDYDLNIIFGNASTKNVKKIKHIRATNLQPRSKEQLATFIDNQVQKLFTSKMIERTISAGKSQDLGNNQSHLSNHFWIAQTELSSDQLMEKYYVPELLDANPAPVGCMLKNWSMIPGRENTPDRNNDVSAGGLSRANSPDLFNDSEIMNSATECDKANKSLLATIYVEKPEREYGMENEEKVYSQEMIVNSPANESGFGKFDVTSRVLKESSNAVHSNNIEQIAVMYEISSHDLNKFPVRNKSLDRQGEVVVLNKNSKEDESNFVDVSDFPQCAQPAFHQSSENIFDDTDPNPMVSFEVYSSEEEKISATSQERGGMTSSKGDIGRADMLQEDCSNDILLQLNNDTGLLNGEKNNIVNKIMKHGNNSHAKEVRFSLEKDFSFHRLSINARLSEALKGKAHTVETVDLIENDPDCDKTKSNFERNVNIPIEAQSSHLNNIPDDVLYISDDDANYSICCESLRVTDASDKDFCNEKIENTTKEDPDTTILYNIPASIEQSREKVNIQPFKSECRSGVEEQSETLTSCLNDNVNEPVVAEINCAESTFAYLDHLVQEFNLPPLKSQQNVSDANQKQYESIETYVTDEKDLESRRIEFCQDVSVINKHASKTSDELSHHLHPYEKPKFDDHNMDPEIIISQNSLINSVISGGIGAPSSKILSKIKSCTKCHTSVNCSALKCISSETETKTFSIPNEKVVPNQLSDRGFEKKFKALNTFTTDMPEAEYVICTSNVNQKPPPYENMSTAEIERELFKYGLKAIPRSKAVRVLHYLFDRLHPYVMLVERENISMEKENSHYMVKDTKEKDRQALTSYSSFIERPPKCAFQLDLNSTQYFFPSKPRKKMAWCAVPLHISFFNLVSENNQLQRQILRYEPINLDEIGGLLKNAGLRYETNDLIAFFDKHCITFRTAAFSGDRLARTKDGNK